MSIIQTRLLSRLLLYKLPASFFTALEKSQNSVEGNSTCNEFSSALFHSLFLAFTKIPLRSLTGSFFSLSSSRIILSFIIIIIIIPNIQFIHALSPSSSPQYPLSYNILRYKEHFCHFLSPLLICLMSLDSITPFRIRQLLYEILSCHGEATWFPGTVRP